MKAKSTKTLLKAFIVSAVIVLILIIAAFAVIVISTQSSNVVEDDVVVFEVQDIMYEEDTKEVLSPPLYMQDDERWVNCTYGSSNVSGSGCGLCVYASALSYLKDDSNITPLFVLEQIGNSCMVYSDDGALVNDIALFGQWSDEAYGVVVSEIYWLPEQALQSLYAGNIVIGCIEGYVGNESYEGHLVLLWYEYGRIQMLDPKSSSNGGLTEEQFWQADWVYFYDVYLKEEGE